MEIVGIEELMKCKLKPYMEGFDTYMRRVHRIRDDGTERDIESKEFKDLISDQYEEELANKMDSMFDRYPILVVMTAIEHEYGPFHISCDEELRNDEQTMVGLLFKTTHFRISNPSLKFYNRQTYGRVEIGLLHGYDIVDLSRKYLSLCLNGKYLIRCQTKEGEGYATAKIREMILNSGLSIDVQANL